MIAEQIGRGSFGAVYKAWHSTLRQHVALKLIAVTPGNEREIERVLDEPRPRAMATAAGARRRGGSCRPASLP